MQVLEQLPSPNLRAYVVWLPVLKAGNVEVAARREGARIHDPRTIHFFDPDARLANEFATVLHLPGATRAWDVYLVFGPDVRWRGQPPAPTYWMHQLDGAPSGLRLDEKRLAGVISGLLAAPREGSSQGRASNR